MLCPEVMGEFEGIGIYTWVVDKKQWQLLGGKVNDVDNAWSVVVDRPGIYALMGVAGGQGSEVQKLYLLQSIKKKRRFLDLNRDKLTPLSEPYRKIQ